MTHQNTFSVKELATLSGVSIRTLHYYDKIGLLPAERRPSGYRIYTQDHVFLLQQILLQKSMGMSLKAIKQALAADDFDVANQLKTQRTFLLNRAEEVQAMIAAVDLAIAKSSDLGSETAQTLETLFQGFNPDIYSEDVEKRWGETEAFKMSRRRTKSYTPEDWMKIKAEETAIWKEAATVMASGGNCESDEAGKLVERHRQHIDRWFYTISESAYVALGELWESDPRFIENIDAYGAGLTDWFAEAARHKYLTV